MALPKIEDARNLSDQELADEILTVKKQLFNLRLQKATRRLEKPHQIKHARHWLSQMITVEAERRRAAATTALASEPQEPDAAEQE